MIEVHSSILSESFLLLFFAFLLRGLLKVCRYHLSVVKLPLLAGRKATRQVVDTWLVSHATPTSANTSSCIVPPAADLSSPSHQANPAPGCGSSLPAGTAPSSRAGSGATTPVRKISAHEFERGGLLKPIVNTIDGTPTFLSVSLTGDCPATCTSTSGPVGAGGTPLYPGPGRSQRRSRHELRHLDEKELIFELVGTSRFQLSFVALYTNLAVWDV